MTPAIAKALNDDLANLGSILGVGGLPDHLHSPEMLATIDRCEMLLKAYYERAALVEQTEPRALPTPAEFNAFVATTTPFIPAFTIHTHPHPDSD